MTRIIHGHVVIVTKCDGLRDHWRVKADGHMVGLIVRDCAGYHTLPCRGPSICWDRDAPTCHSPTPMLAIETLIAETVDHA